MNQYLDILKKTCDTIFSVMNLDIELYDKNYKRIFYLSDLHYPSSTISYFPDIFAQFYFISKTKASCYWQKIEGLELLFLIYAFLLTKKKSIMPY